MHLRIFVIDADIEELEAIRYWLELDPELSVTTLSDEVEALRVATENPPDLILLDVKSDDPNGLILCELLRNSPELDKTMIIGIASEHDAQNTHVAARLIESGSSRFLIKPIDQWVSHRELKEMYYAHIQDGWLAREIEEFNERKDTGALSRRLYVNYMEAWRLSQEIASLKTVLINTEKEAIAGRLGRSVLLFVYRMIATLPEQLQALDNAHPQSNRWRRILDEVLRVIHSIQTLIQTTLNSFDRTGEKVDLVELINQSVNSHRERARQAGIQIQSPSLLGAIYVQGEPDQLLRMFHHLIINSIESMLKGGILSIEPADSNGNITIEFIDTGNGFSEPNKAGTLGYSTKPGRQGIGLFFCKRIAEQHHAQLIFNNRTAQHGAKVTLIFPSASAAQFSTADSHSTVNSAHD